jgi:hypothetical protein
LIKILIRRWKIPKTQEVVESSDLGILLNDRDALVATKYRPIKLPLNLVVPVAAEEQSKCSEASMIES